jgi:hypothetical protein
LELGRRFFTKPPNKTRLPSILTLLSWRPRMDEQSNPPGLLTHRTSRSQSCAI